MTEGPEGLCRGSVGSRRGLASEVGSLGVCVTSTTCQPWPRLQAPPWVVGEQCCPGIPALRPPGALSPVTPHLYFPHPWKCHRVTPSSLQLQTPPLALNPDLGIDFPQVSRGYHKSPALSPPLRLALASAQAPGRNSVTFDSCISHF